MILKTVALLNQYANLVMTLTSVLLVFVTAIYAFLTWRMAREMRLARIADLQPYLIIDVVRIGRIFYLIIKNKGKTPAEMVRFSLDKNVETMWKNKLDEMPIFKSGITSFSPGKEFIITLGPDTLFLGKNGEEAKYPKVFTIAVEYKYFNTTKTTASSVINLEEYMYTGAYPNEIAKTIENVGGVIGKSLDSIMQSAEKLSKLEEIASPTGLDISQSSLYRLLGTLNEETKEKIKFDLNRTTLMELVELLGIELKMAEKILEKRYGTGFFESFNDLKDIDGMTDELIDKIKRQTFICTPNF